MVETAIDLLEATVEPSKVFVDDLITEGLTILFSAEKSGKSCLALGLCLYCSYGNNLFMGKFRTHRANCLYYSLETSRADLKDLQQNIFKGIDFNKDTGYHTYYRYELSKLDARGMEVLDKHIKETKAEIIVLDVFPVVKPSSARAFGSSYERDYPIYHNLDSFARERHISIILVIHDVKNPNMIGMNRANTSKGGLGGAKNIIGLMESDKGIMVMTVTGKRLGRKNNYRLYFDKDTESYYIEGSTVGKRTFIGLDYDESRIMKLILSKGIIHWKDVLEVFGEKKEEAIKQKVYRLVNKGYLVNLNNGFFGAKR